MHASVACMDLYTASKLTTSGGFSEDRCFFEDSLELGETKRSNNISLTVLVADFAVTIQGYKTRERDSS